MKSRKRTNKRCLPIYYTELPQFVQDQIARFSNFYWASQTELVRYHPEFFIKEAGRYLQSNTPVELCHKIFSSFSLDEYILQLFTFFRAIYDNDIAPNESLLVALHTMLKMYYDRHTLTVPFPPYRNSPQIYMILGCLSVIPAFIQLVKQTNDHVLKLLFFGLITKRYDLFAAGFISLFASYGWRDSDLDSRGDPAKFLDEFTRYHHFPYIISISVSQASFQDSFAQLIETQCTDPTNDFYRNIYILKFDKNESTSIKLPHLLSGKKKTFMLRSFIFRNPNGYIGVICQSNGVIYSLKSSHNRHEFNHLLDFEYVPFIAFYSADLAFPTISNECLSKTEKKLVPYRSGKFPLRIPSTLYQQAPANSPQPSIKKIPFGSSTIQVTKEKFNFSVHSNSINCEHFSFFTKYFQSIAVLNNIIFFDPAQDINAQFDHLSSNDKRFTQIVIPYFSAEHWVVFVLFLNRKVIRIYNSLEKDQRTIDEFLMKHASYLSKIAFSRLETTERIVPLQLSNTNDSGFFALYFMETRCLNHLPDPKTTGKELREYYSRLAQEIFHGIAEKKIEIVGDSSKH